MTEIVKVRRLHFLSGRDKNGSLVSISSVLATANEIIKIAPSGFKDFNTELVVKIDQYPNRKKLPTNVLESERYRLRTVVYNRLDLEKVLAVEFKQDESSAFKIEFPETITHPLSMEQLGTLLSRWHGYDIIDADAILTHVRDNQYTITAKPNSLGYTGIATIIVGDFVTVEPGEPEVPVEGTPTESFFFTDSKEVVDLNVNGIVVPISELYRRYGVSVSVWPDDGRKVFGLVNTSTNTLQATLPETALVSDYSVNESLVTQTDGARTFKLSPMIGVVEKPTPSEEILDDTDLTFSVNVTDPNALGKLIECWVDGEKITFAASFENEKIKIYRNSEGDLVVSNLAYEVTSVIVAVKTASLGYGEGALFGSGVSVEIVDGYEVISFNLAAAAPPVEDPVPSNITLGSIKGSTVYSSLVALAGADLLNEDELEEEVITVGGEGTEVKALTINIKPYTEKGLLAIPFNIAADDWAKVNALPADTVVGECTVLFNGDVITAPLTAGGLSRMGINNPDEDSYTFTLSVDVPFVGSIIFNLDFDTGSSNRYHPTTTTFEINVLNYVENWIKPEVLSPAELKQFYGVDDVEFENDVSVVNWLAVGGGVNGDDLFYNTELVYEDRRGELPTGPLFFSLSDTAKNYIAKPKESGQVLFTIDVDGTSTEVTVSDLNIVTLTNGDVKKHCFRIDVAADQIKALKVIKVTGDLDGPLNVEELTGGLFGNSTHTFNYNVTVTPLPAILSPVSVSPATEELVNFVIDRMNNEGIDVTDRTLFGQYEEAVEQNDSYWTVTQLHPYAPGVKQVSIFITFPKEVLDKLETIPEDTVVFRAISDVEELAEALSLTALDVISQMFELGDSVYLPINHTVGTGVLRETTVWSVDFDGLENFYSESAFTLDILAEMEPAPSASVVNLLDISGTDIEYNYTLTDYSTFNGKDTLEYSVNQLGHGLDIHVPFSIPAKARNLLENSAVPEETRIVAKVNGNVVQTYTVEQISKWGSLVLDIANSHFTYTVPEEEVVHKNQDVTYDITFESDFDGTGRVYSQYTSEHSVVVRYEYDSQLCPVVPVVITDRTLYDQIKAKNPEMSTLDFEEFIKHEVAIDGLDVKIHVKEDVEYYQLPLFYKADSAFAYANVYPTVDTIIAQVDSEPLTAGAVLTKVVEVDDEYYFVKMVSIGSTGDFQIIADWDGEEYSYCKQTTTVIPYTVYIPLPEAQVAIINFGKDEVLEGTYTPGYILEVYSTENGEKSELTVSKNEAEGTWTVLDYSQLDGIDYFIEAQLLHPDSRELMAEDSNTFLTVIEGPVLPDEMYFTTTAGSLYYEGNLGDVITLSDSTTYTVSEDGSYSNENVPAGKHKVKLVTERSGGYVGIDGEALIELHNFPTLSAVTNFDFCPNSNSPNLVKVPDFLPSNLTKTTSMFVNATSFNQDISGWDTSNVTDMKYMFEDATSFNQPLNNWNVSKVADMRGMFYNCTNFNQDLSQWCVFKITQEPSFFSDASSPLIKPVWGTCPRGETSPTFITIEYDDKSEIPLRGTFTPLDADEIELSYRANGVTEYIVVEMDNESGTYTVPAFVRDIVLGYAFEAKLKRNNEVLAENSYFLSALLV